MFHLDSSGDIIEEFSILVTYNIKFLILLKGRIIYIASTMTAVLSSLVGNPGIYTIHFRLLLNTLILHAFDHHQ